MEELNIPTYRVKKIDSDEYVEGWYNTWCIWWWGRILSIYGNRWNWSHYTSNTLP